MVARRYRNRRIGEFFKELKMTEGRCTGIPKIIKALKDNGSPAPLFKTDDERSYFLTILKIHPDAKIEELIEEGEGEQVSEQVFQILKFCRTPRTKQEILNHIGLSIVYLNYKRNILPLIQKKLLAFTIPDKPNSRLQKYKTTEIGFAFIQQGNNN